MTTPSASHRLLNFVQSALLLGLIAWSAVTAIAGPENGLLMALAMVGGLLFAPALPRRLLLSAYQAQLLTGRDAPSLVAALAELARRAGLQPAPALYRVPSRLPNAFGLGRPEDRAICVTHRLLDQLDGENSPGFWRMRSCISPTATCGSRPSQT
ncbi:hypothetical protein [Haematobacter missouriensis]|uniref:hypothetical protein n=1 Tax=Haematobacter missouriensis TaxID=366616 RepID=UPI000B19EA80|nr:hypothetical protein [Haematobacter missouriensis]